jgi:hypothetical protein
VALVTPRRVPRRVDSACEQTECPCLADIASAATPLGGEGDFKARADYADTVTMDPQPLPPGGMKAHDRIEIIDQALASRVRALVESATGEISVLRLEQAARLPEAAPVRWFDGVTAWQATAHFEHIDATRVRCQLMPADTWEPASARRSQRVRVGESQLLVRIAWSSTIPGGRRAHTECLEASATGCRATWSGQTPRVGDTVDLSWDTGGQSRGASELGWIAARVTRVIPRPTGVNEVCFGFETTKSTQAARIHSWHHAWLQRDHQRQAATTAGAVLR